MKLFLPRPGRKVQTFVDRAALELSLEKNFLPEFQSPIPPSLFLTSFNGTSSSGNADRKGLGREGGERRWRDSNSRLKGARIVPAGRLKIQWKLICRA